MSEQPVPKRPRSIFPIVLLVLLLLYTNLIIQRYERVKRIDPATATPAEMLELNLSQEVQAIGNYIFAFILAAVISVPTDVIRRWGYRRRLKRSQNALAAEQPVTSADQASP